MNTGCRDEDTKPWNIGDTLGARTGEKRKRRETDTMMYRVEEKPIEPTQWSIIWEDEEGATFKYFDSEEEYHKIKARIRRASFGENFTKPEVELITLLLHIDTKYFPALYEYRSRFISNYFNLKRRIECGGIAIDVYTMDPWSRHMALIELKADLLALVFEARCDHDQESDMAPTLNHEVRELLIEFCEVHETAVLTDIMNSRWGRVLRHTDGYEHLNEGFGIDFKPWLCASGPQEIKSIQGFIEYKKDRNLVRFMNDLIFVLVEVWMRLHDGHELYCDGDCTYRELMGAKIRALYIYGCLLSPEQIDRNNSLPRSTLLRELVEEHIHEVAPLVAPTSTSSNSKYLKIQALLIHDEPELVPY